MSISASCSTPTISSIPTIKSSSDFAPAPCRACSKSRISPISTPRQCTTSSPYKAFNPVFPAPLPRVRRLSPSVLHRNIIGTSLNGYWKFVQGIPYDFPWYRLYLAGHAAIRCGTFITHRNILSAAYQIVSPTLSRGISMPRADATS